MKVRLPKEARRLARAALRVRPQLPPSRRYGTPIGLGIAAAIGRGDAVDGARVLSFLQRARPAYQLALKKGTRSPRTSRAVGAYYLWGGEPARRYLERLI